jgi:hypothetical protein
MRSSTVVRVALIAGGLAATACAGNRREQAKESRSPVGEAKGLTEPAIRIEVRRADDSIVFEFGICGHVAHGVLGRVGRQRGEAL